jgi:hypothetical protein
MYLSGEDGKYSERETKASDESIEKILFKSMRGR